MDPGARAVAIVGAVALAGVVLASVTRVSPDARLMADPGADCLQFSQDGGTLWGDITVVTLDEAFTPVPGGEYLQGDFLVRNICDVAGTLKVFAGRWHVSDAATGTWRADLSDEAGKPVRLTGPATQADWGVLVGETPAPTERSIPVTLILGIPGDETIQSFSMTPGWAMSLEETTEATGARASMDHMVHLGGPTVRTGPG